MNNIPDIATDHAHKWIPVNFREYCVCEFCRCLRLKTEFERQQTGPYRSEGGTYEQKEHVKILWDVLDFLDTMMKMIDAAKDMCRIQDELDGLKSRVGELMRREL